LHQTLREEFDDEVDLDFGNLKPIMQFRGKQGRLAHVLNRIVKKILSDLNTGTAKEARERVEAAARDPQMKIQDIEIRSANSVVKIRLLILWIGKTPQCR
jgi:hypothetical protein